jgi:hypothetical protein
MRCAVLTTLLLLLCATTTMATTVTLTMTEVPNQTIHGLTVTKSGVGFTFIEPTLTLFYNSTGPGSVTFVQDPSIQGGPARPFSVTFSEPVNFIQFGLAELTGNSLLALVTLSNGSVSPVPLSLTDPFPEGQFTYNGPPVTSFFLAPAPGALALAFDNLTVSTVSTVPEPASLFLLAFGLFASMLMTRVRRRHFTT